jgi:hypothetical protein
MDFCTGKGTVKCSSLSCELLEDVREDLEAGPEARGWVATVPPVRLQVAMAGVPL